MNKMTSRWKINGKPILAPTGFSGTYTRQAKTAGRSESGIYDDDRIQDGIDFTLTFVPKSWEEMTYIAQLLSEGQYIDFTYRSIKTGNYVTQKFYVGERNFDILQDMEDDSFANFNLTAHLVSKDGDLEDLK